MDAGEILAAANNAGDYGNNHLYRIWNNQWAVGYAWSENLRAQWPGHTGWGGNKVEPCPGRYPPQLYPDYDWDMYYWNTGWMKMPDGEDWYTQAISPKEVPTPAMTVEAWDTNDLETLPGVDWWSSECNDFGKISPGWHSGPVHVGGAAVLNGSRHDGPPPVLYADGSVRVDATAPLEDVIDLESSYLAGTGIRAYTWGDWSDEWGTLHHFFIRREIYEKEE
jgi:hypothetical protein